MGLGIARNGDTCGGAIIATATKTFVNGILVARLGDAVETHGTGPHAAATMVEASSTIFAEGIAVCRQGDHASCGDSVTTYSPNVSEG